MKRRFRKALAAISAFVIALLAIVGVLSLMATFAPATIAVALPPPVVAVLGLVPLKATAVVMMIILALYLGIGNERARGAPTGVVSKYYFTDDISGIVLAGLGLLGLGDRVLWNSMDSTKTGRYTGARPMFGLGVKSAAFGTG